MLIRFTDQRQFMIGADGEEPFFTIVGVVGDTRFSSLTDEAPPIVYLPLSQFWDIELLRAVVRTSGTNTVSVDDLQGLVWRLDRGASVSEVQMFDTRLGETIARPRFAAYLLAAFGAEYRRTSPHALTRWRPCGTTQPRCTGLVQAVATTRDAAIAV